MASRVCSVFRELPELLKAFRKVFWGMRMGWGGLGWAELVWGGEGGINYTSRKVSGKFSLDVLLMEYFSPESVFAVAIMSGKLIGTSPPTIYSSGLYLKILYHNSYVGRFISVFSFHSSALRTFATPTRYWVITNIPTLRWLLPGTLFTPNFWHLVDLVEI